MTDKAKSRLLSIFLGVYLAAVWAGFFALSFGFGGYDGALTRLPWETKAFLFILLLLITFVFVAAMVPDRRRVR